MPNLSNEIGFHSRERKNSFRSSESVNISSKQLELLFVEFSSQKMVAVVERDRRRSFCISAKEPLARFLNAENSLLNQIQEH